MMKKYREWADKPYTRGDMVKQYKWALIITLIGEAILWTWYYWDTVVCWFESVKLKFKKHKNNENDLYEDEG